MTTINNNISILSNEIIDSVASYMPSRYRLNPLYLISKNFYNPHLYRTKIKRTNVTTIQNISHPVLLSRKFTWSEFKQLNNITKHLSQYSISEAKYSTVLYNLLYCAGKLNTTSKEAQLACDEIKHTNITKLKIHGDDDKLDVLCIPNTITHLRITSTSMSKLIFESNSKLLKIRL